LSDFDIAGGDIAITRSGESFEGEKNLFYKYFKYFSPEQIAGRTQPASDQYALSIVVYEWMSGELPFEKNLMQLYHQHMSTTPPPLRTKVPLIPPAVEDVVMHALAKDPKDRFESVQAFAEA